MKEAVLRFHSTWIKGRARLREVQAPLRAELFNREQLSRHAEALAEGHRIDTARRPCALLDRLSENEEMLRAFNRSTMTVDPDRRITPAAEWLLDNFFLIEEQIQLARRHLPSGYSRELPRVTNGHSAGLPRVYDIVLELISHVDAQIDAEPLSAFVAAYQSVVSLNLGELWAIPIMLRLGLIENLQRVASRLAAAREDRDLADTWVDRLQAVAEASPSKLVIIVADMARSEIPVSSPFVAEFCQRLSRQSPVLHLARSWLEQRLIEHGMSIEQLVQTETQSQAADQVSVSHSIASLRFLSAMDWKDFVEDLSLVQRTLNTDPSGVFQRMDFATRDRYRHAVEFLARHGRLTEVDVAAHAVNLAAEGARLSGVGDRRAHVGYYLIDKGRPLLGREAAERAPWRSGIEDLILKFPLSFYGGGISLATALASICFVGWELSVHLAGWRLGALTIVFFVGVSQSAVALVNRLATSLVRPRLLPRLDFSKGISSDFCTMVVIPTMLAGPDCIDRLIETIEIHHLANRDKHIHFALLTDFEDGLDEWVSGDDELVQRARRGIAALNRKYALIGQSGFFLFHRPRRWNEEEGVWMGYERKRGKLMEFNTLLRGGSVDSFSERLGDMAVLPTVRFVITLDTDTLLPLDAARRLVGTLAHPLNRPVFDLARGVVVEGYGILQPRIGVSLPSARRSWFVRLFAGDSGIDPYTREVSDVYQDLFHEGSFVGKGIYDVDAFQKAVHGRFPENTVLSHDLLEACHARSALVSDVEFYDEFPSRHNVDADRRHRWIRGDWQIAQWLLSRVPTPRLGRAANPLSALSQWKILDNLRRSLVPVALLLMVLGLELLVPGFRCAGPLLLVGVLTVPGVLSALVDLAGKSDEKPWSLHLRTVTDSWSRRSGQIFIQMALLPYEAFLSVDAIGRALFRLLITGRHLLEWRSPDDIRRKRCAGPGAFYSRMWSAPATAVLGWAFLMHTRAPNRWSETPLLACWLAAPLIAWWMSRPIVAAAPALTAVQLRFLGGCARRTWAYFETFVTAADNGLPPDNFQEIPVPTLASRTSPTNIGVGLLSFLAARDLGYTSAGGLIARTRSTFSAMGKMERHRGHFYNWYDTRTLQPLLPLYVSSVDSGNLAGHLLTLGSGLREQGDGPLLAPQIFNGLRDTVWVLAGVVPESRMARLLAECELPPGPVGLRAGYRRIEDIGRMAADLAGVAPSPGAAGEGASGRWASILANNCEEHLAELRFMAPWLDLPADLGAGLADAALAVLDTPMTLKELACLGQTMGPTVGAVLDSIDLGAVQTTREAKAALSRLAEAVGRGSERGRQRLLDFESLAAESDQFAAMDFSFLFNEARDLFATGYNVGERRRDSSYYDLLASEARLCSYVAIALGQVPQEHWFSMGRLLVASGGDRILVSWSGSMFEYLMPLLVMPTYENTLLGDSCRSVVRQQIAYGRLREIPWGVSESCYNRTDVILNYQYRAFGVPGLGLKRDLAEDLVIAPYASAMALMMDPVAACENLQRLEAERRCGDYGFFEAIDYTASRLPPGESSATIRCFMAHHQGMSLLALGHLLRGNLMQKRFMACPMLKAADLLLQERIPKAAATVLSDDLTVENLRTLAGVPEGVLRVFNNPSPPVPDVHLLSNGRYHVAVTSAGGGYSRWRDLAVTRWREDATRDCWGTFVYLRDLDTGVYWSSAHQPTLSPASLYEVIFTQSRAEFRLRHGDLEIHTEIGVSPEDDVELRRISIVNRSSVVRMIEVTSYAEVVLAKQASDAAHPAFSNLFVETEFNRKTSSILCARRSGSESKAMPALLHLMMGQGGDCGEISCETDRLRFVGRNGTLARPAAMLDGSSLSNTVGSVLDPIVSLRRKVTLAPHETAVIDLVLGVGENRESALALVEKYQSARMADRAFDLAWTHSQVTLRHLNATEGDAQIYGTLAGALIFSDPARRAPQSVLTKNRRGQSGLWSYGISGDAPLVLLRISSPEKIEIVRLLIQAHSYWRMKGLTVELVILVEDVSVYRQSLHEEICRLVTGGGEAQMLDKAGGVFVRRIDQVPTEDRILMESVARVVLDEENGSLAEQVGQRRGLDPVVPPLVPSRTSRPAQPIAESPRELLFQNGLGGFTRDGHEYVITLKAGQTTPAPWVNVIANPFFGTVVSESGSAYTWSENAHEFRLTPWNNDPVQDSPGEAFYVRDEQTGQLWSPTPGPVQGPAPCVIRHGFGYTVFERTEQGIESEMWVYVAMDAPVKLVVLKIRNRSGRPRRLSVTGYWEWVLGDLRQKTLLHVQTEIDLKTGALLARNGFNADFADRFAFIDVNDANRTVTGDRREFLGRNGTPAQPAALLRSRLSGRVGAGLDPCGAVQVAFDLDDGQEREASFRLGAGNSRSEVQGLIQRFRRADASRIALEGVWSYWNRTLGAVNVDTPDPAVNVMANGWLLYQTLGCRLLGRTGFYQSGGAYGFRDQLQDVMALVHAEPALTREHLLRAASRQFKEGDVQHWWHPPMDRGVRTHFSDDFLWLPYATCRYVSCLADTGVLDEKIGFLEGRPVKPDEDAYYDLPNRSEESATLYQHCVRSIERSLKFGIHGLPLMGGGDWNDGMNLVGHEGRGESVWLAFFLYDVLIRFSTLARARNQPEFADYCLSQAAELQSNIEKGAWDGQWYRRAYFDNGGPLGSHENPECQIDSLPQSWSVISGAGEPGRSRQAMNSVDRRLVRRGDGLIQLLEPPFDTSDLNPGYIKGYIPGVRENGGQYTHGAIWTAMAFAMMGEGERAWELFTLLNPVRHGDTAERVAVYKVEPYVVAADVYAVSPHIGRGGWTWYTGSAGWMYRLLTESLMGLNLEGDTMRLSPHLPKAWDCYKIHYRYRQTVYHITFARVGADLDGLNRVTLDGRELTGPSFPLRDDRIEHAVTMTVG